MELSPKSINLVQEYQKYPILDRYYYNIYERYPNIYTLFDSLLTILRYFQLFQTIMIV